MLGAGAFYYDGQESGLTRLFAALSSEDIDRGKQAFAAMRPRFAWPLLGEQTLTLFRSLRCVPG